jgi:signal transduction histidine kinase/ligand-binding sensor domain-containing protein
MSRLAGWITISVALLLACSPGFAAPDPAPPSGGASAVTAWARHAWQPSDGMPDGPIIAIVPLSDGSLLAGGRAGRCRLDGDRVRPLTVADPQFAKLGHVPLDPWLAAGRAAASPCTSRCRTADGTIFSGFLNGPPSRSRDGKTHRLGSEEGVLIDTHSHVATDDNGHVWLAQNNLLAEYDPGLGRFVARAELPVGRMTIAPGRDGGLWIKVNTQMFRYRDGAGLSLQAGNAPHGTTILYEDSQERLWVGSDFFGLYLLSEGSFTPVATVGEGVFAIADDQEGGLWVGTSTAVNRLWPAVIRGVVATESGMQLPNSLCEDGAGHFWLATESGWLGRIEPRDTEAIFRRYTKADGWNGVTHCVAAGPDGQIFIGTRNDGIHRYDGERFEKIESPPGTPPTLEFGEYRIEQLIASRCGDLWAVTYDGLFRYRDASWLMAAIASNQAVDLRGTKAIVEDTAGTVWVASTDGRLCRFPDGGGPEAQGEAVAIEPFATAKVSVLAATRNGDVWAVVRDVGLLRIRDGRTAMVGAEAGLPSAGVVALAADTTGLLWCVTSRQIFAVSLTELDVVADGKQSRPHPWVFSGEDEGVVIDPADRSRCQALVARDGKIWITLRRGLAIVDPSRLARPVSPPPAVIEELRVAGQPVAVEPVVAPGSTGSRVALPPDPRGVEIEIATRGFTRPSNASVMQRLEGFDADWIEHPIDRPIRYERLPAGKYTLRLRSEHDLGAWENGLQSFVIDVRPLLWERPWFRVAMLALAAALAAAAAVGGATLRNRSRLLRLEQQAALERQRMRIARDMHDEAGTTATQLSLLADLARGSGDGPARAERLEGVSRIARQLVTSLDEMVWAVNPANDTLAHLVSYIGQTASETLGRFGVACRVRTQEPLPECTATAELRRGMLMIAKEAVSNIVEHAGATAVEIDLSIHEGRVRMSIEDDGCGLPETSNGHRLGPGGNGLGNMRARAGDLGGSCRIEPAVPRGTRVVVEVPLSSEAHA